MIGAFLPPQPQRVRTPRPQTITITCRAEGDFDVQHGEGIAVGLVFDEMLGEVARLTSGQIPRYMRHVDAILGWMRRRADLRVGVDDGAADFEEVAS